MAPRRCHCAVLSRTKLPRCEETAVLDAPNSSPPSRELAAIRFARAVSIQRVKAVKIDIRPPAAVTPSGPSRSRAKRILLDHSFEVFKANVMCEPTIGTILRAAEVSQRRPGKYRGGVELARLRT